MNQPAPIGHNQPPTPFAIIRDKIEGLYEEARLWLDGEPIATQGQADDLSNLLNMIRAAEKEADDLRKEENAPFDAGKREVQERYAELIADTKAKKGKTVLAKDACKKALQPWLQKQEEEQRAKAEAARLKAEEERRKAQEVMADREPTDLASYEAAEQQIQTARAAEKEAAKLDKARPQAAGGIGRAAGLRTTYIPVFRDPWSAVVYYWGTEAGRLAIEDAVLALAKNDARRGIREIPGFDIEEEKTAV